MSEYAGYIQRAKLIRYAYGVVGQLQRLPPDNPCPEVLGLHRLQHYWEEFQLKQQATFCGLLTDNSAVSDFTHFTYCLCCGLVASLPDDEALLLQTAMKNADRLQREGFLGELSLIVHYLQSVSPSDPQRQQQAHKLAIHCEIASYLTLLVRAISWKESGCLTLEEMESRAKATRSRLLAYVVERYISQHPTPWMYGNTKPTLSVQQRIASMANELSAEKDMRWRQVLCAWLDPYEDEEGPGPEEIEATGLALLFESTPCLGLSDDVLEFLESLAGSISTESLDEESKAIATRFASIVEDLPSARPTESVEVTVSRRDDGDDCGGLLYYSVRVDEEQIHVSSGGSTWTSEAGSDSFSGSSSLRVDYLGRVLPEGDTSALLWEILNAADDPDFVVTISADN